MPRKILSRFLGNEKARAQVLSGIVVALMVISAFTGLFLMSERASAAAYSYNENFDEAAGDCVNGTKPDAPWYTYSETMDKFSINDTTYANGTASFYVNSSEAESAEAVFELNTDGGSQIESFSCWINIKSYVANAHGTALRFLNSSYSSSYDDAAIIKIGDYIDSDGYSLCYKDSTDATVDTGWDFPENTWCFLNLTFNWTTHEYQITFNNGVTHSIWVDFNTPVDEISYIVIRTMAGSDVYFDDFTLDTDTDLGGNGPTLPSTPTGISATNYTVNFTASSISGFDGDTRWVLLTANTNDTSGDTVWSNATSYGVISITNDGTNQVNISWTKGTGATNTVVEVDTINHSPWNVGDGMEIYNDTGTSTVFDYNDDGTVTFDAETTYYIALFSYNASGYSDAATTSVTTGNVSIDTINIHIEDIGASTYLLPKENITVYESGDTSGGWTFDAITGNISITTATGLPLAPGDPAIELVFKAVWGAGAQPDGIYYDNNAETLDCSIELKHTA